MLNNVFTNALKQAGGTGADSSAGVPLLKASYSKQGYIYGLPPIFPDTPASFKQIVLNSMMYIRMRPVLMTSDVSIDDSIISVKNTVISTNSDLLSNIEKTLGIRPGNDDFFTFAIRLRSFSETFTNTYGESYFQEVMDEQWGKSAWLREMLQYRSGRLPNKESANKLRNEIMQTIPKKGAEWLQKIPVVGKAWAGGKIDLPKIWKGSAWNFDDTLEIMLISPTSDPIDILNWVVKPAYLLKFFVAPQLLEDLNYYSFGTFVDIELPYVIRHQISGVSNLTIQWGGEQALFTKDQLPLMAQCSLSITPLKQAQELEPTNANYDPKQFLTSVQSNLAYTTKGDPRAGRTNPQSITVNTSREEVCKRVLQQNVGEGGFNPLTDTSREATAPANIPGVGSERTKPPINRDEFSAQRRSNLEKLRNKV